MFFDSIDDLANKFKWLDQLNTIVFSVWRDKSALEYKEGPIQDLRILYMNYINEMRQQCNILSQMQKEIEGVYEDASRDLSQIGIIAADASINGCAICHATGYQEYMVDDYDEVEYYDYTTLYFVARVYDIPDIQEYAEMETGLYKCEANIQSML